MQQQPSAQGIASLYMGNPGALQQRVQKEQQAKPGLPPDLKKLMALNIVTNEEDAAKRQQAMNALNQMAPAGQEPPTVAQSIQEQAKQKIQAQMLQQQRQQMALQDMAKQGGLMSAIPERTPQPEAQPQGIDELPVELGLAGGGIVAFAGGDSVFEELDREKADKLKELSSQLAEINPMLTAAAQSGDQQAIQQYSQRAQDIHNQINAVRESAGNRIAGIEALMAPTPAPTKEAPTRAAETTRDPNVTRETMNRVGPMAAPKFMDPRIIQGAPSAPRPTPRPAPGPRPAPAPAAQIPAAAPAATPAAPATGLEALYEQNLRKRMEMDPEARAKAVAERYEQMIGRPDTSQYDRLIAELEGRRKQFEAPEPGFNAFMEFMEQIAAQGPQRTSVEAGAKGATALTALNKERQTQQFDLTKQMVDIAQKKLDTERGFKKELFTLTEKERDDIDKQVQDATKEYGLNKRDADKYKRDLELEALRQKGALELEGVRSRNQIAAKGRDYTAELIDAMQRGDKAAVQRITDSLEITKGAGRVDPALRDPMYAKLAEEYAKLVASAATLPEGNKVRVQRENEARAIKLQLDRMAGRTPAAPVESAPKPGDVQDGYKFLGGNPADPKNWQKV